MKLWLARFAFEIRNPRGFLVFAAYHGSSPQKEATDFGIHFLVCVCALFYVCRNATKTSYNACLPAYPLACLYAFVLSCFLVCVCCLRVYLIIGLACPIVCLLGEGKLLFALKPKGDHFGELVTLSMSL